MLEDVCDNLFNPDPYYQQGGDMVRVGGVSYKCAPKELIGKRIQNMVMSKTGESLEPNKKYTVGGGASVNPETRGPAIYDVLEEYIIRKKIIEPSGGDYVKVTGVS